MIIPSDPNEKSFRPEAAANGHIRYRLIQEVLARSVSPTWCEAKSEWELDHIFFADRAEPGTCLCGHAPIIETCVIRNRLNGNAAVVGNCCVKRFMGSMSERIFASLRRIARDRTKALNADVVEFAFSRGWITTWEREFCLNTFGKQYLSAGQVAKRIEINSKVLRLARGEGHHA
jgi:hypothetical protein